MSAASASPTNAVDDVTAFEADFTVDVGEYDGTGSQRTRAVHTIHVLRKPNERGVWSTRIGRIPFGDPTAPGFKSLPHSVEVADDGGPAVARDADGMEVKLSDAQLSANEVARKAGMDSPNVPDIARRVVPLPTGGPVPRRSAGAWLGTLVYPDGKDDGVEDRLLAAGATAAGGVGSARRYVLTTTTRVAEVLVDSTSGLLLQESLMEGGRLVATTTYEYGRLTSGELLRDRIRHEILDTATNGRRVIDMKVSNAVLHRSPGARR